MMMNRSDGRQREETDHHWRKELLSGNSKRLGQLLEMSAAPVPIEILINLIRVRQAQAESNRRRGYWNLEEKTAVWNAAEELIIEPDRIVRQMSVNQLHGGGARTIVENVDEILLERVLAGHLFDQGDPHRLVSMIQQQSGTDYLQIYRVAANIAILQGLEGFQAGLSELSLALKTQAESLQEQVTLIYIQLQPVKFAQLGNEFSDVAEALTRIGLQLGEPAQILRRCWDGNHETLKLLCELCDTSLLAEEFSGSLPLQPDAYLSLAAVLRTNAVVLNQFSQGMRHRISVSGELAMPSVRPGPAFNQNGELVALDTLSLTVFDVVGADAAISAAANGLHNSFAAYFPFVSSLLLQSLQRLTAAVRIMEGQLVGPLEANVENSEKWVANSPLQAEKLIPFIGFERAAQVAKIAVLTEKPIKTVVVKMKMMTEKQAEELFAEKIRFTDETE